MAKTQDLPEQPGLEHDEYDYADDVLEENSVNESPTKPKFNFKSLLFSKKVLAPVGVIIAVFILYYFLQREPQVLPEIALEQHQVQQRTNEKENEQASLNASNTVTSISPAAPPSEGLQTQVEALGQIAQQNQAQVQQLQSSMQQTESVLAQMGKHLEDLSNQLDALNKQVASSQLSITKKSKKGANVEPRVVYHIRAIIAGRAWLDSSQGKSLDVKVGDTIPAYGQVQLIDPTQGLVITSLGDTISYGATDS